MDPLVETLRRPAFLYCALQLSIPQTQYSFFVEAEIINIFLSVIKAWIFSLV